MIAIAKGPAITVLCATVVFGAAAQQFDFQETGKADQAAQSKAMSELARLLEQVIGKEKCRHRIGSVTGYKRSSEEIELGVKYLPAHHSTDADQAGGEQQQAAGFRRA